MLRKLLIFTLSTMFIWAQTSFSYAQNYHFDAFDHMKSNAMKNKMNARGLSGQVGFKIPFGHQDVKSKKAFYGVKLAYGQEIQNNNPFEYGYTRDLNLMSSGFDRSGVQSLSFASYDMLDEESRKNIFGNGNGNGNGMMWGLGLVVVAVGVCWAAGCFDSDSSSSSSSSSSSN